MSNMKQETIKTTYSSGAEGIIGIDKFYIAFFK